MAMMVLVALLWSSGGILIKLIHWNPLFIAGSRSLVSAVVITIMMKVDNTPLKINRHSIGAGIGLAVCLLFFVTANKFTTAANAIVLQYSAPIFILIISGLFLKKPLRMGELLAVTGTMIGMILFFMDQLSIGNILGNVFGIIAGIGFATMFTFVGLGGKDDSVRMSGILLAHLLTAIIGMPSAFITGVTFSTQEVLCALILGIFQLGIPYVLYGKASRYASPLACSMLGMLEPLLNPVWVAIFIHELPGKFALLGSAIIITVVTLWCVSEARASE